MSIGTFVSAQSTPEKRWERAIFEVKIKGKEVYQTDFQFSTPITHKEFNSLADNLYTKEGIVDVIQISDSYIEVVHMDFVDYEAIESFVVVCRESFTPTERVKIDL